jgi:hypothetical protein
MFLFRRLSLSVAVIAILSGVVLPASHVFAQAAPAVRPPLNLMTSPLPLNVVTKPGQPVTADIRVKNNGTQPETLKIELLKFGASGDTGRPQILERGAQDQYFNWVSFSETNFAAEPNVWKTIHMSIKPPKEAAFGYYYAVIFSRANPDRPSAGRSAVEGGVASLVLLNVDTPGARREAQVVEFVATKKVYEFLPTKFTVKLRNGGNVHVSPGGSLFIKRGSAQVGALDFNSERGNILPGSNRIFEMTWADGFPVYQTTADGKTTGTLKWDFSKVQKLRFGRYTANLVAIYDDGQRDIPIEAVVSFWVIPWRILGVIFLILLFVFAGLWGMGRLIWKAIRRQTSPTAAATLADEPEPDPNSLAAATRSSRRWKKSKAAPETTPEVIDEKVQKDTVIENAVVKPAPKGVTAKKAAASKPRSVKTAPTIKKSPAKRTTKKVTAPKLATKKQLATKPVPKRPTKKET